MRLFLVWLLAIGGFAEANFCLDTEVTLEAGYRRDSLHWNVAGPDQKPNILSDLHWKDLQIAQGAVNLFIEPWCNILLRGKGDYGVILKGHNTDQDFAGHNRTHLFSSSHSQVRGNVYDLSGGIGYILDYCCFKFIPLIGYSYHEQYFRMNHLHSDVDKINDFVGPISGLHSHYRARWSTGWTGFDFEFDCSCWPIVYGTFEYHWTSYHGTGHWNLRKDFDKDFQQHASGNGQILTLGLEYAFNSCWCTGLEASWQFWKTCKGHDRVFFDNDTFVSRLNVVRWNSFSIMGNISCSF